MLGHDLVPGLLLFLAAVVATKWLSGAAAGRAVGLPWEQANLLGVLLNCRGLMILVVAFVAGELGGITPQLVAVISLGSIVTTLMTRWWTCSCAGGGRGAGLGFDTQGLEGSGWMEDRPVCLVRG